MSWNLVDGVLKPGNLNFHFFNSAVTSVNSSFDDSLIIAGSKDHSALVWDSNQNQKINYSLIGHTDVVTCVDFIAQDIVASSSYDTTLRVWKLI